MRPFLAGKQSRTNDPERLRCIAWKDKDFDNQMATFQPFCAKLDLNLDHHTESPWKPDPKAQPTQMKMNFIFNLNAFSWKAMQPTATCPYV